MQCLENGVSQWPKLEGRFPQVSGISFAFDGSKPPGSRIDPQFIKIGDEYVHPGKTYRMVTKAYLANGKDGYDVLAKCNQVNYFLGTWPLKGETPMTVIKNSLTNHQILRPLKVQFQRCEIITSKSSIETMQ